MVTREEVLAACRTLAARPGGCVRLAHLRAFVDADPLVLDAMLLDMDRARFIQLESDPDRLGLTAEDRAAVVKLAGRDKHLVREVIR